VVQHGGDKATHHRMIVTPMCPMLLPAAQDGDVDALLDALLSAAKRILRQQMAQSVIDSDKN
jgi:hypothetical protein